MKDAFPQYDISKKEKVRMELEIMSKFFSENGDHPCRPHIHSFYQIIWFRRGHGIHYVDFKPYPVASDTLFFISPGQIHYFDGNSDYEGVIIHFDESLLSDEGSSENVFLKYNVFNAFDAVPYFHVDNDEAERLASLVDDIRGEMEQEEAFAHRDCLQYLVKLFLINIQRSGRRGEGEPLCVSNSAHCLFVRFRMMLEHHYQEIHTVKQYADRLNVSSKTLTNSVAVSAHTTPLRIINDRITLEAKRLLTFSDMKIKEISYALGFEDPSYFVKFFKRSTGQLPLEFRE